MTPQKFKPGDKVGIVNPAIVRATWYGPGGSIYSEPSKLDPNKEYTVLCYAYWEPVYSVWAVRLNSLDLPVAETILAPLLPADALARLLEETLLEPINK